jgi:hypothetical protein
MDLGLDKLVEMIQERFGRRVGTIVLASIAVAAFATAIHAVFSYLIVPSIRYAPSVLGTFGIAWGKMSFADGIYALTQAFIGALAAIIFLAVSRVFYARHIRKVEANLRRSLNEVQSIAEDCRVFTDKNHAGLHAHADSLAQECDELVQNALAKANALLAEAHERIGEPSPPPLTLEAIGPRLARQKEAAASAAEKMKLPKENA